MKPYRNSLKQPARHLRTNMTDAEQKLWFRLRRKQIRGVQFYRQKPIQDYIVDFYCAKAGLVIELDGSQHYEEEHRARDAARDGVLTGLGLRILRFDNREVLCEMDSVVAVVDEVVGERLETESEIPPLNPPFLKGGT